VVEVADQKEPNKLVMDKIQSVDSVGRTETHIAIEWSAGKSRESVFARERWLIPQRIDAVISL
jgi:hypothetical protein